MIDIIIRIMIVLLVTIITVMFRLLLIVVIVLLLHILLGGLGCEPVNRGHGARRCARQGERLICAILHRAALNSKPSSESG